MSENTKNSPSPEAIAATEKYRTATGEFGTQPQTENVGGTNGLVGSAPAIDAAAHQSVYAVAVEDAGFALLRSDVDSIADSEYFAGRAHLDAQKVVALANPDMPTSALAREAGAFSILLRSQCNSQDSMVKTVQGIQARATGTVGDKGMTDERADELAEYFMDAAYDALEDREKTEHDGAEYWQSVGRFNSALQSATSFATRDPRHSAAVAGVVGQNLVTAATTNANWRKDTVSGVGAGSTFHTLARNYIW